MSKINLIALAINPRCAFPSCSGMRTIIIFSQASSDLGPVLGSPIYDVFTGAGF